MLPLSILTENSTAIIVALLAAGAMSYVRDAIKYLRLRAAKKTPEAQAAATQAAEQQRVNDAVEAANNSVVVAVRSNAMLAADAERYRREIEQINARHDHERAAWQSELEALKADHASDRVHWDSEKAALRAELDAMEARWRQALEDLVDFRQRIESAPHDQHTSN